MTSESTRSAPGWPTLSLQGLRIDAVDVDTLHAHISRTIARGDRSRVLNVNVRAMNLAAEDTDFARILADAEIVFCDGAGVQLAAWMCGRPVPPRITYADWAWRLAAHCEERGHSLYLLGARRGVASRAADRLRRRHPALRIAGTHHGYFDHFGDEAGRVLAAVNEADADVLMVCFGMPLQERWIDHHWTELDASVFLAGGACLDYVSGAVDRGPAWMTDHGLEWLYRLVQQPGRLWRRNARAPLFFGRVLGDVLRGG